MAHIVPATFSDAFSSMNIAVFWSQFRRNMSPGTSIGSNNEFALANEPMFTDAYVSLLSVIMAGYQTISWTKVEIKQL